MRVWFLAFGRIICVAGMLNICGGQWLVLQSLAWTGMLIKYSQDASLIEALAKTFDGEHPCNICKGLQQEKETDQEQSVPVEKKFDLKCLALLPARILYPPSSFDLQPVVRSKAFACADAPPVPPPRRTVS
jgi:hypothetical protein